jgi:hypothetical protein
MRFSIEGPNSLGNIFKVFSDTFLTKAVVGEYGKKILKSTEGDPLSGGLIFADLAPLTLRSDPYATLNLAEQCFAYPTFSTPYQTPERFENFMSGVRRRLAEKASSIKSTNTVFLHDTAKTMQALHLFLSNRLHLKVDQEDQWKEDQFAQIESLLHVRFPTHVPSDYRPLQYPVVY